MRSTLARPPHAQVADWLIPARSNPLRPLNRASGQRCFHLACDAAGICTVGRSQLLRHCFGAHWPDARVDLIRIGTLLGHAHLRESAPSTAQARAWRAIVTCRAAAKQVVRNR